MGRVGLYRDTGVVLRCQKLGEADRIVTLLTHRHGKVRATAKGIRRTTSKFGARLEPFGHVDLQLHTGRSLDIITQVQTIDAFGGGLVVDYPRYTAGCALLRPPTGSPPRRASRRGSCSCCSSARCAGSRTGGATRTWCSTRSCCAPWSPPGTRRRSPSAPAAGPSRRPRSPVERSTPIGQPRLPSPVRGDGGRSGLRHLPSRRLRRPVVVDVAAARGPARRRLGGRRAEPARLPTRRGRPRRRAPAVAPGAPAALAAAGRAAREAPGGPRGRGPGFERCPSLGEQPEGARRHNGGAPSEDHAPDDAGVAP